MPSAFTLSSIKNRHSNVTRRVLRFRFVEVCQCATVFLLLTLCLNEINVLEQY